MTQEQMFAIKVSSARTLSAGRGFTGGESAPGMRSPPASAPTTPELTGEDATSTDITLARQPEPRTSSLSGKVVSADHPLIWGSPWANQTPPVAAACSSEQTSDDEDDEDSRGVRVGMLLTRGATLPFGACASAHREDEPNAAAEERTIRPPIASSDVPDGPKQRGIRWPARRASSAGVTVQPRPLSRPQPTIDLPRPAIYQGAEEVVCVPSSQQSRRRRARGRSGLRWPSRRGATSGLDNSKVLHGDNTIALPRSASC